MHRAAPLGSAPVAPAVLLPASLADGNTVGATAAHVRYDKRVMLTHRKLIPLPVLALVFAAAAAAQTHWVPTWGASPAPQLADQAQMQSAGLLFEAQTVREIVHTSIGGTEVRVRLSNAYGKDAVQIAAAHVAVRTRDSAIAPGSDRALTFSGRPFLEIPANAESLSDPVTLNVPVGGDLAVSLFLPKAAAGAGVHYSAMQTSYIGAGDLTAAASLPSAAALHSWVFLTGVDVLAPESASAVVTFGDSITDGARSESDANHRWPDILAARLHTRRGAPEVGVVNAGIGGNRILHDGTANVRFGVNALARFDRDVLAVPGVKFVIVMEGINDIGHAGSSAPMSEDVSAEDIIAGMKQMIERAHEKGFKIFGATLTPFEGTVSRGYFSPEKELKRKAVNEWIRTGKAFDGVIDFDKTIRDPAHPDRMLPAYDGGDHLHPGDAGYKAMGDAVDLGLFR
ncbi:MAG TPA: SGNH/GDSL hydrolase family protein [Bryobacteraceae bacterium]|nr:SGNH/GDSL hydrolase family protein [Bryobacteraceae bacterium]